jgi:hypothetical protein
MKLSIVFAAVVLLAGSASISAQKVTVDVDKTVNFSSFKTFGWTPAPVARNPMIAQLIVNAVDNALTARGLTKTADNPDIKVAVVAAAGIDIQAVGPTWNNANYAMWGGYTNPAALMNVTTGTLLIDLENKDGYSIFRGVAKETLNRSVSADVAADAKSVEKLIKKAVAKMFSKYPAA